MRRDRDAQGPANAGPTADPAARDDEALAKRWRAMMGGDPPGALPKRLLRLALAWEEQARGEKTAAARCARRLDRAASGLEGGNATAPDRRRASPGATLIRDWRGRTYRVEVLGEARFRFDGRDWRSLSAIARAITGQRRNGPAFFGLREEHRRA